MMSVHYRGLTGLRPVMAPAFNVSLPFFRSRFIGLLVPSNDAGLTINTMKSNIILLPAFLFLGTGCQRRLSATEIKDNLEKAMSAYLRQHQRPGTAPLRFDMVDVHYSEEDSDYLCQFTIKLHRPDGSDTTGMISSKVSKDFSTIVPH